ncbi:response regulator [Rhabdochromatium marinum]|uniref:hybrid sensor histidine kinase/response regulator n=1 Tax=Rhabdochromatium marinum TaxID=48729 RepID=UPI001903CC8F|nr:response regulator [Rhabdochromatium marinum]MBK1647652.1 hybrid sensor histidine kinase/response regulator [Rhabdochromatium marinum]
MNTTHSLLVVDDSPENLKLMASVLKQEFSVHAATSGLDALDFLSQSDPPDLILLDIMMPGMDGYELCERIKANPALREVPIIFATGRCDYDSETRGFDLGAVDYITKPIHPPVLLARVRAHLALAEQNRQTRRERDEIASLARQLEQEVAERQTHETRLRALGEAVDKAPASVVITDADGVILYVNQYFTGVTGYWPDEVIGENPRLLKSGQHDEAFYQSLWQTIANGDIWRGEMVNKTKHGELLWESVAISPIRDEQGAVVRYVGIKENIDDRKQLERIKADVERIMHHDLKTPLNAILAIPELLLMDENLNAEQRESIGLIRESAYRMYSMIDMSLDLYKMETGQFHCQPQRFSLIPILHEVISTSAWSAAAKQLTTVLHLDGRELESNTQVFIDSDARLLSSLFNNLLANAIEASPLGATLHLDIQSNTSGYIVDIRNRGAVPVPMRACFFEKYRTHGKARGTGLGTYSAKLIADTLGYKLSMHTSDADDSTCLSLSLTLPKHD